MTMKASGNVGVGTSTPGYRLQVGNPGDGTEARANAWNLLSSREYKRNVARLGESDYADVLEQVRRTDVVHYEYTADEARTRHLGIIAEDAPADVVTPDGQAVSLGDYAAFLLAAIKAQQAEIEVLGEEVRAAREGR